MKTYQRVLVYLLLVLLLTSLLSPWVATLWNAIIEARPGWEQYRYSFSRIFDRLFMILAIILFFFCPPLLKIQSLGQLGLQPLRRGYSDLLRGYFLALASVIALGFFMSLAEIFTPYFRLSLPVALERSFKALLAAFTVGFLEEIFFRGIIFKGLLEDWKPMGAFVITNLFYSAIHFVKPAEKISLSALDAWAGIRHVTYSFEAFLDPITLFPGLFGLFLVGIILSYAFLRTGSLYLSIGLHAGWIFGLKTIRVYGDYRREDLGWLFGSSEPKLISGVAGWLGIIAVGVVIHYLTSKRQRPSNP